MHAAHWMMVGLGPSGLQDEDRFSGVSPDAVFLFRIFFSFSKYLPTLHYKLQMIEKKLNQNEFSNITQLNEIQIQVPNCI